MRSLEHRQGRFAGRGRRARHVVRARAVGDPAEPDAAAPDPVHRLRSEAFGLLPAAYFDSDFFNADFTAIWGDDGQAGARKDLATFAGARLNLLHIYNWNAQRTDSHRLSRRRAAARNQGDGPDLQFHGPDHHGHDGLSDVPEGLPGGLQPGQGHLRSGVRRRKHHAAPRRGDVGDLQRIRPQRIQPRGRRLRRPGHPDAREPGRHFGRQSPADHDSGLRCDVAADGARSTPAPARAETRRSTALRRSGSRPTPARTSTQIRRTCPGPSWRYSPFRTRFPTLRRNELSVAVRRRPGDGLGHPGGLLDDALDRIVESVPGRYGARRLPHEPGAVPVGLARDDGVQHLAAALLCRDGLFADGRRVDLATQAEVVLGQIRATASWPETPARLRAIFSEAVFSSTPSSTRRSSRPSIRPAHSLLARRRRRRRARPAARAGVSTP